MPDQALTHKHEDLGSDLSTHIKAVCYSVYLYSPGRRSKIRNTKALWPAFSPKQCEMHIQHRRAITTGYVITFHMKEKNDVMQAVPILDSNKLGQGRY